MYHPLLEPAAKLKDQELENRILDLTKKYHIAARMGQGGVCQQILCALEMYKEEMNKRQQAALKSSIKKQDKDFDDLINVN
jgi:hypothetical protein